MMPLVFLIKYDVCSTFRLISRSNLLETSKMSSPSDRRTKKGTKLREVDFLKFQLDGRTVNGKINQSGGGVARNMADALGKLQLNPYLISAVGDEEFGRFVLNQTIPHLTTRGMAMEKGLRTGTCMVLCDHTGESIIVVGDFSIHEKITRDHVERHVGVIARSSLTVVDGNLSQETTEFVLRMCHDNSVPVWFEPTDLSKAWKPFVNKNVPLPTFISPNFMELQKIFQTVFPERTVKETTNLVEDCITKGYLLGELIENIIITLGKTGVIVIRRGGKSDPFFSDEGKKLEMTGPISHRFYTANLIDCSDIANVSGAGDCFASGFIAAMLRGDSEEKCIELGSECSAASLRCSVTVPKTF